MTEPLWIEEHDALAIHGDLMLLQGGAGLRDQHLLLSALAKPRHLFAYSDDCAIELMAAAYTTGIARNHPFLDGNKRTAFEVGVAFLELNGYLFIGDTTEAAEAILKVVAGQLDEAGYAAFLKAHAVTRPASL